MVKQRTMIPLSDHHLKVRVLLLKHMVKQRLNQQHDQLDQWQVIFLLSVIIYFLLFKCIYHIFFIR